MTNPSRRPSVAVTPARVRAMVAVIVLASRAAVACPAGAETKPAGVPIIATDPNEGNTYGVMPIILRVCPADHSTSWIFAPSVTWNSLIHLTGSLRWYFYPERNSTLSAVVSASTQTNRLLFVTWQRLPYAEGMWTDEAVVRAQRTLFARFFGIGSDAPESAESSFTLIRAFATERRGLNLGYHLNVGALAGIQVADVDGAGVPGLPISPQVFPGVPGMETSSVTMWQGLSVRYDDRVGGDYAEQGVRAELWGSFVEGLKGAPMFWRGGAQVSGLWPEVDRASGAARALWTATSSNDAPFYDQSQLGGSYVLRGFSEGRFVDRQAWTIEFEQRIRLLTTSFFGVTVDWRADPFIAVGQVFDTWSGALSHPRASVGIGMRALIRPNVVGRVDLAYGGEGLKVYVQIGYPY